MTRKIESKFWIGDKVYFAGTSEWGFVIGVVSCGRPGSPLTRYTVTWSEDRDASCHDEFELSDEPNFSNES